MTKILKGNAVIGQSGGPTGVINQSLVGVIEEVAKHQCFQKLLGAVHGVRGIINENFIDLDNVPQEQLQAVANTPSAALGSTRDKPDQDYCNNIFEVFKKNDVRYFFYIGGNDSASTANIVNDLAKQANYDLKVFHIPKTIDNDLLVTDHCPGYGSAAAFVAQAVMGDNFDNLALPGIKIDVVMGRHAGFLTAAAKLAQQRPDDGPHLIYIPEAPVSMEQFTQDVVDTYERLGRCLVVVSEGICDTDHTPWAVKMVEEAETDSHGNVQLSGSGALGDFLVAQVKKKLPKARLRADTFGYLQRSFPGIVSAVDAAEARQCGRAAASAAAGDGTDGSIAMKRLGNGDKYAIETFVTPLDSVAVKTKSLPAEYINKAGNNITDAFIEYVKPLVGKLPQVGFLR
ncbi:MAG: 6-phosphofructokinase [Sedimentisphaerales bacterium]|nr:6-phosphofructokinase [Sedimentisphaerales bacterium]